MIRCNNKKFTPKQWAKAILNEWIDRMNCCGVWIEKIDWEADKEEDMKKAAEFLEKYVNALVKRLNLHSEKHNIY